MPDYETYRVSVELLNCLVRIGCTVIVRHPDGAATVPAFPYTGTDRHPWLGGSV